MEDKFGIFAPWVVWAKECEALFEEDPGVEVAYDSDGPKVTVRVKGVDKAESIAELLPCEMTYGGVTMPVEVVPANDGDLTVGDHLRRAFAGNPVLVDVEEAAPYRDMPALTYALFAPEVAQMEVDNAASPYGIKTKTYEQIAKDVLGTEARVLISSAPM